MKTILDEEFVDGLGLVSPRVKVDGTWLYGLGDEAARIIASAPYLLKAAKDAVADCSTPHKTCRPCHAKEKLRAAIAKAEGRTA